MFHETISLKLLAEVVEAVSGVNDPEEALRTVTTAAYERVGDRQKAIPSWALHEGETQFFVCGVFLHDEAERRNILVAEHGFPPEQRRLTIPEEVGHPGWVVAHQRPLLLENTDEHASFKQILKTSRMGSAMYAPMFSCGNFVGQLILAAQARNTFASRDLDLMVGLAAVAGLCFERSNGRAWFKAMQD